jgi:hypothetical protein
MGMTAGPARNGHDPPANLAVLNVGMFKPARSILPGLDCRIQARTAGFGNPARALRDDHGPYWELLRPISLLESLAFRGEPHDAEETA